MQNNSQLARMEILDVMQRPNIQKADLAAQQPPVFLDLLTSCGALSCRSALSLVLTPCCKEARLLNIKMFLVFPNIFYSFSRRVS